MTPASLVQDTVDRLQRKWRTPRRHEENPFRLVCRFSAPVEPIEWHNAPEDLLAFWRVSGGADFFLDVDYGQWGLRLLSPRDAEKQTAVFRVDRQREVLEGDIVVGTFHGDAELLVVRCDQHSEDFGHVLVVLPLDSRNEWRHAASSLGAFLSGYADAQGAKFWETQQAGRPLEQKLNSCGISICIYT